ncbi:sulfotransferase 1C4-like [Liolophura sinensis]|uniref:sulfotransferase 1C4-like n=1 Tax=Liolophura sinensis TaxID=3198878 RepID=UPI0031580F6A
MDLSGAQQKAEVKTVKFTDPDGQKLPLLTIGYAKVFPIKGLQENFHKLQDLKFKNDDIIVTAYPRSGMHFIWEIVHMLKQGSSEYINTDKEIEYLEMFYCNDVASKSDRVIKTHLPPELMPTDYMNRKCKFIHIYRNPKDTMVSLYNKWTNAKELLGYTGTFSGFFELAMEGHIEAGNWITFELKYEEFFKINPNVRGLMMSYEDFKLKPISSIKKLSEFLELDRDDDIIASIANAMSCSTMKAAKLPEDNMRDWKDWFTVAQNERFNEEYKRRMKDSALYSKDVL